MSVPFRLIRSEVKPLTQDLAIQFRALDASPTERDLNPSRLRMLREKAENGLLINFHWATANVNGKVMRVNGQHSSTMLADLNGEFPQGLKVHLDEYEVDGLNGLTSLFRQFDDRKSGRSSADVAGAFHKLEPNLQDVPPPTGKLGIEGINYYKTNVEGTSSLKGDEQYSLFHESTLHSFLKWIGELFSIKTPELRRPAVVAAMYGTFDKNEKAAREFWESVARGGDEYETNAPATVLDEWLKKAKTGELDTLKPGQYYLGCIYAWNAYLQKRTIERIKADLRKNSKGLPEPHAE